MGREEDGAVEEGRGPTWLALGAFRYGNIPPCVYTCIHLSIATHAQLHTCIQKNIASIIQHYTVKEGWEENKQTEKAAEKTAETLTEKSA